MDNISVGMEKSIEFYYIELHNFIMWLILRTNIWINFNSNMDKLLHPL